eukprot:705-Chlamydomonas_euryale.AAC.3
MHVCVCAAASPPSSPPCPTCSWLAFAAGAPVGAVLRASTPPPRRPPPPPPPPLQTASGGSWLRA